MSDQSVVPAHTPGPWTLRKNDPVEGRDVVFGESRDVAIVLPWMGTCDADGALIAAAPALLEALEAQVRAEEARETYTKAMTATVGVPLPGSEQDASERQLRDTAQQLKAHALKLRTAALAKARAA
jgi:hypothetical protein